MSSEAIDQSVDVIRRTEQDYQSKCAEVASLRQRLADTTAELEKTKSDLRRSEIRCDGLLRDVDKRQQALDVIVKELTAKRQIVEQVTQENTRLKRDLDTATRYGSAVQGNLSAKSKENAELTQVTDSLVSLYMNHAFSIGVEPSIEMLRCLHGLTEISALNQPATYTQISSLVDVFNQKDSVNTGAWQTFDTLAIKVDHPESFLPVVELLTVVKSLTSVTLYGLDDTAAEAVAGALATAENITSLSLPDLAVSDTGFNALMKVIANREILAIQKDVPLLIVRDLDLSNCQLTDSTSFDAIHGQCLESISLAGSSALRDAQLHQIVRECPSLHRLSLKGCTGLTNEALVGLNKRDHIKELDITGCTGINAVKLDFVEVLISSLNHVIFLECPKLRALPSPVTHFQALTWVTPELQEVTLQSVSLHAREFNLLSECSSLTHLTLLNCRVQGLELLLRRMRKLQKLAIHTCKGVQDSDVLAICSTIEVLDLTDCFCITDRAVIKVTEMCQNLKELTLKRCSNVTDAAIIQLEKLEQIEYLNVLGAKKVSVLALHRIINALPALKCVVHETLITANVRVEREDEEESNRTRLQTEEKQILTQRETVGMTYAAVQSPTKPTSARPSSSPRLHTPASTTRSRPPLSPNPKDASPIPTKPATEQDETAAQDEATKSADADAGPAAAPVEADDDAEEK